MAKFNHKTRTGRRAYQHAWYLKNKEKQNAKTKAWHEANKEKHNNQNKKWALENPERRKYISDTYYARNVKRIRERTRRSNKILKFEVLSHYSPKEKLRCSWRGCKITDMDMLSLDHIKNNGAEARRGMKAIGGVVYYSRLRKLGYPEGLQTLCHNHQWKKEITRRYLTGAQ